MGMEQQRQKLMATSPQQYWGQSTSILEARARERLSCRSWPAPSSDAPSSDMITPHKTLSTKGWSLEKIISSGRSFHNVPRISAASPSLSSRIDEYESQGIPLVIEGWHERSNWPKHMFNVEWLANHGKQKISVRNVHDWSDRDISMADFIAKARDASLFAHSGETERLYGKDMDCPSQWNEWLHSEDGITSSLLPDGPNNLLLNHPSTSPIETLMCYLGIGDTFTPCHKDLCASSGQNLMCYTENGGSSFWFMTESSSAPEVADYFHKLKEELDHETHTLSLDEMANAPFKVYVIEQKLGDLVLVPPRSCHQVVNYGGITLKTSWSRMTLKGLMTAYYHELPIYQRVCRPETYRVKSTVLHTIRQMTMDLEKINESIAASFQTPRTASQTMTSTSQPGTMPIRNKLQQDKLAESLEEILEVYDSILVEERVLDGTKANYLPFCPPLDPRASPSPSNASSATLTPHGRDVECHVICDFCGADVFQSFFECTSCVSRGSIGGDGYVVCSGCYAEGRSCQCEAMVPMQCRPFEEILNVRRGALKALYSYEKKSGRKRSPREPERELLSNLRIGTFRAGCVLQEIRRQKKEFRMCTARHPAPGLNCKKCHFSRCFEHILSDQRIHSIDALLWHERDDLHEKFHQFHKSGKIGFADGLMGIRGSAAAGSRPDLMLQRAYIATIYGTCKPINTTFAKIGWYDRCPQIIKIPSIVDTQIRFDEQTRRHIDREMYNDSPLSSVPSSPSSVVLDLSSTTSAPSELEVATDVVSSKMGTETSQKRKRTVLDYIDVPSHSKRASMLRPNSSAVAKVPQDKGDPAADTTSTPNNVIPPITSVSPLSSSLLTTSRPTAKRRRIKSAPLSQLSQSSSSNIHKSRLIEQSHHLTKIGTIPYPDAAPTKSASVYEPSQDEQAGSSSSFVEDMTDPLVEVRISPPVTPNSSSPSSLPRHTISSMTRDGSAASIAAAYNTAANIHNDQTAKVFALEKHDITAETPISGDSSGEQATSANITALNTTETIQIILSTNSELREKLSEIKHQLDDRGREAAQTSRLNDAAIQAFFEELKTHFQNNPPPQPPPQLSSATQSSMNQQPRRVQDRHSGQHHSNTLPSLNQKPRHTQGHDLHQQHSSSLSMHNQRYYQNQRNFRNSSTHREYQRRESDPQLQDREYDKRPYNNNPHSYRMNSSPLYHDRREQLIGSNNYQRRQYHDRINDQPIHPNDFNRGHGPGPWMGPQSPHTYIEDESDRGHFQERIIWPLSNVYLNERGRWNHRNYSDRERFSNELVPPRAPKNFRENRYIRGSRGGPSHLRGRGFRSHSDHISRNLNPYPTGPSDGRDHVGIGRVGRDPRGNEHSPTSRDGVPHIEHRRTASDSHHDRPYRRAARSRSPSSASFRLRSPRYGRGEEADAPSMDRNSSANNTEYAYTGADDNVMGESISDTRADSIPARPQDTEIHDDKPESPIDDWEDSYDRDRVATIDGRDVMTKEQQYQLFFKLPNNPTSVSENPWV